MVEADVVTGTEERILEAARIIFQREGFAGARMQDIADEAGINKAMLHYYFRNKERLFEVILRESLARFLPRVIESLSDPEKDLFDKIRLLCGHYIQMAVDNPGLPLFVLNTLHQDPERFFTKLFPRHNQLPFRQFAEEIEEAVRKRKIRKTDPRQLILHILSCCLFPFLAKPMVSRVMQIPEAEYAALIERRKTEVPEFIIASLRKS